MSKSFERVSFNTAPSQKAAIGKPVTAKVDEEVVVFGGPVTTPTQQIYGCQVLPFCSRRFSETGIKAHTGLECLQCLFEYVQHSEKAVIEAIELLSQNKPTEACLALKRITALKQIGGKDVK